MAGVPQESYRRGVLQNRRIAYSIARNDIDKTSFEPTQGKPGTGEGGCKEPWRSFLRHHEDNNSRMLQQLEKQALNLQQENEKFRRDLSARERQLDKQIEKLNTENRNLYVDYVMEKHERGRWNAALNVRGPIESIAQRAIDEGKITNCRGTQDNLNQITALGDFKTILHQEVYDQCSQQGQSVRPEAGRGRTAFCRPVRSFSQVARQVKIEDEDGRHFVVPSGHFVNLPDK
ncbi:hypothetical protein B9Z19DRAFT_1123603 [Tuber borchii]|uniref:Uncharacterized protein n=1 Tax=Tuber borchii TaxID=42251 RepID=A0A2T6ZYC4_TUBBO|nr:hypothetical protein B9Z19DRAFT_1123603 [Tuber borchii]